MVVILYFVWVSTFVILHWHLSSVSSWCCSSSPYKSPPALALPTPFTHISPLNLVDMDAMKKTFLRIFGPELILINTSNKTARSAVSKKCAERVSFFAASAAKFCKRANSITSERAFPGGFGEIFGCSTPSDRGISTHKNSLASCQRCRHSVEPRALTCPFKQSNLSAWSRQNL